MINEKKNMKKITLSLTNKTDKKLRTHAKDTYGGMKGALSMIVETALQEYFRKLEEES